MADKTETSTSPPEPKMSRRAFVRLSVLAATAGGAILVGDNLDRIKKVFRPTSETQDLSLNGVITEIKSRYGIRIPGHAGEFTQYQVYQDQSGELSHYGEGKESAQITLEEAQTIKDSLKNVPSVGKCVQLIIPFREDGPDVIAGGNYWGLNWDFFLDPSKYQKYPQNGYLSNESGVKLVLPNKRLGEPLPTITQSSNFLPLLSEAIFNEIHVKPINKVVYPWTTFGEQLRQVIIHEGGGHGWMNYAGRLKVKNDPKAETEASSMSPMGGIPFDTYHPIISSFAMVNGWKLIPYGDYLAQWGTTGQQWAEDLRRDYPKFANWPVWDRDPTIWGAVKNRQIRLDTYASYGTIKETFATFFMFFSLSRVDDTYDKSLLTRDETNYFERMFRGLSRNPDAYIRDLIKEFPGPSYGQDLVAEKGKVKESLEKTRALYPAQLHILENGINRKIDSLFA
jgi:hypothetical protein